MNDPIRYTGKTEGSVLGSPHWEHPEGEWVKYEDYARLKAEAERLEHKVNYWRIEAECDNARWLRCLEDLEKLRGKPSV